MKRLLFNELLLTSLKEKSARRFQFHPEMTIVKGENDTGKSSLLKSLYRCLGAHPRMHGHWQEANVKGLLRFKIDDIPYSILQDEDSYTLFDGSDNVIRRCGSVTNELAPLLADLLDFRLTLVSRQSESVIPPPAFLFLPYYMDQDSSWQKNWAGFQRLQQFPDWRRDVIEYQVGIKPNEYYHDKGILAQLLERVKAPRERYSALNAILTTLKQRLQQVDFTYDIEAYTEQVKSLLVECDALSKKEEAYKDQLVKLYNQKTSLVAQIEIAKRAISEMGKDYTYASERLTSDTVECPICGAAYENSFAERFEIARDEDRCHELFSELVIELQSLSKEIEQVKEKYGNIRNELDQIESILSHAQGEIKLKDIIESEGRKQVRAIIEGDIQAVKNEIWDIEREIGELQKTLKAYENSDLKRQIIDEYQTFMESFLELLNVENLPEKTYAQIYASVKETGSDLPRALLAYYFGILNVIHRHGSSVFCPIVIDAPHQQDQDIPNSRKMLEFVLEYQPQGSQVILGVVNTFDVSFPGDMICLSAKDRLLNEESFEDVMQEFRPMLNKSMQAGIFASGELPLTSI